MKAHPTLPAILVAAAAVFAARSDAATATFQLPVDARGGMTFQSTIDPVGDADTFAVFLAAGDALSVSAREAGPVFGLFCTLALTGSDGTDVPVAVTGQGTARASFKFTAATPDAYRVRISGDPGGFAGSIGTYALSVAVKRVKIAPATFAAPGGGPI
jgi:hypothetical protein